MNTSKNATSINKVKPNMHSSMHISSLKKMPDVENTEHFYVCVLITHLFDSVPLVGFYVLN